MLRQIDSVSKRFLNNTVDSEMVKLPGKHFLKSIWRQENENERALTIESGYLV